jgi:hypothetical protein
MKAIMKFNDDGELKHRLFFDEKGKVTAEEDRENCSSKKE